MSKKPDKSVFYLGIRVAWQSALTIGGFSFLVLLLFFSVSGALFIGAAIALFSFGVIYMLSLFIIRKRLQNLSDIISNISDKHPEPTEKPKPANADELDYLIRQSHQADTKIKSEFKRYKKIENYRKEFIGDISHELKTPTFAIQGFIETLLDGALEDPEVNREFLEKAMNNANRLDSLTKDLMEISRLESGELKIVKESIHLNEIIHEVVESLQHKANQEGISLEFDDSLKDNVVKADRNQIRQVLINLIDNGIKYNRPNGKVTISLNKDDAIYGKILVTVTDTGIGIDQSDHERITERFFRVDKSRSRENGGTGLGLSIVKHIIEAHKEKLFIESTPGEGSKFSFSLQLGQKN